MNILIKRFAILLIFVVYAVCTVITSIAFPVPANAAPQCKISGFLHTEFAENSVPKSGFIIEILDLQNSTVTNEEGYFEFNGVPQSQVSLNIQISKPAYLTRQIANIPAVSDIQISLREDPIAVWAGDLVKDNAINMSDIMEIAKSFNTIAGDARYELQYDLNMDKAINMSDIMTVAIHFNTTSAHYPPIVIPPNPSGKDQFGIKMLANTLKNGREWYCKWDQGMQRTYTWGQDILDPELIFRGSGNYTIYGSAGDKKGQMRVTGSTPRIYVRGTSSEAVPPLPDTPKWNNVEVTFYSITTNPGSSISYAGIEAVVKTNHCPDSDDCTTRGYGGRMLFDGRIDIEKECSHKYGGNKRTSTVYPWADKGKMRLNQWIGYKLVARNCENDTKCKIEIYRDMTGGLNGGTWELMTSFTDYDGWSQDTPSCCELHKGRVLLEPDYSVYLRTDGLGEQYYKYFSIREIEPLP